MNEKKEKNSARPERVFRRGAIAASVWRRQAPSGFEYFDFSLSRAWKAKSTGREGYSLNFFSDNEGDLAQVIRQAACLISEQLGDGQNTEFEDDLTVSEMPSMN